MIHTIIHGILLGFALMMGLILALMLVIGILKKARKQRFDLDELIKAFKEFESHLQAEQHYELLPKINKIIEEIVKSRSYTAPKDAFYTITPSVELILREAGESQNAVKIVTKYSIELKPVS